MKTFVDVLTGLVLLIASCACAAQGYPDRPVKLVIGYPPGGGLDFVGRTLAQRLSEVWGQPVTVENKSGASGAIGAEAVARSRPDGLTLLLASPAEVLVGPIAGQKTPYDAETAFVPVVLAGETALALIAHPSLPARNLAQLIESSRQQKREWSYGTPGAGSSMHFAGEALGQRTGLALAHVPYRGAAPAVSDVLGNQIPLAIVGLPPVVAQAKAGKLKVLAVTTAKRSSALPDVPSVSELPGLADYRFSNWMLLLAPRGTPPDILGKIAASATRVLQEPSVQHRLLDAGVEPSGLKGAELDAFLAQERARYTAVAKSRNVRFVE